MVGEEMFEPVMIDSTEQMLEDSAVDVMGEMFSSEIVSSVRGMAIEARNLVLQLSPQDYSDSLIAGGVGALAGLTLGIILTRVCEKYERDYTGHDPVPRLGIGCSIIPKAMVAGAVTGFVARLILS